MTIENSAYPRVTEIMKITDTADGNGAYLLELKIQYKVDGEPVPEQYLTRPGDPFGVNPQIRQWLSENPEAPVHAYVPPPELTDEEKRTTMQPLTARQFRLGLVNAGIAPSTVTTTIGSMPAGADKDKAQIEWEYATTFNRTHPLISTVGTALGLTEGQIDIMWLASANL